MEGSYTVDQIAQGLENLQNKRNKEAGESHLDPLPFNAKLFAKEIIEHI